MSFGQIKGLFDSSVRLPSLVDELPVGVAVLDLDRQILLMNRPLEVMTGFNREEVWGIPCHDVLRSNLCQTRCPVMQALESNAPVTHEGDIISRDHQKIPVRLTAVPLTDARGNVVGFMETLEDIRALKHLNDNIRKAVSFGNIIGRSPKMEKIFRLIPVIAQTDSSLLITGETGTGKDAIAEVIHRSSERSKGSFIKVNCGALPETLLESELFGHKKGAFTGAVSDKMGRLRLAHNGTLYLTEIGDLPLPLQVKLLTFLDDKVVFPLGSTSGFQAEVRIIAATHRDLERMVKEGLFRQDLLFRLNVIRLHLPPLRERDGDIELLLDHFLKVYSTRFGKNLKGFSKQTRQLLLNYLYPGNVRELRNIVEYASNICQTDFIGIEHLPSYLADESLSQVPGEDHVQTVPLSERYGREVAGAGHEMNWQDIEKKLIVDTLLKVKGRKNRAAEILGWGRTTLWRKMKQYGLES